MTILLDDETYQFLKVSYQILEQHKVADEALRMHMALLIYRKYGINLGDNNENWTLDMDTKTLEQQQDNTSGVPGTEDGSQG